MTQLVKTTSWEGSGQDWSCAEVRVDFVRKVTRIAMACTWVSSGILQKMWERPFWEGVWFYLDLWDRVRLSTASSHWNSPRKYGPHGELFFFVMKKERVTSNDVPSNPIVSAETLKACAPIGLHLLVAADEDGSSGSRSPDLGDVWRYGRPKSPDWDVESWTESEGTSSSDQRGHNVENFALNVLRQDQPGEKISLFLEDWELARVALSCHIALDMLCQEMHEAW